MNGKLVKKYSLPENQEHKFLVWIMERYVSGVRVEIQARANVRDCILIYRDSYPCIAAELSDRSVLSYFVDAYGADHG
jgi:hypothetical protein